MLIQKHVRLTVVMALAALSSWAPAQDQKAEIQKRLASQFVLTKTTADRTDIVGDAGSILVLHKDGLLMFTVDTKALPTSTYKDGNSRWVLKTPSARTWC